MDSGIYERDRCEKECFANLGGRCMALSESYRGECPFQRKDITMAEQNEAIAEYNSKGSIWKK